MIYIKILVFHYGLVGTFRIAVERGGGIDTHPEGSPLIHCVHFGDRKHRPAGGWRNRNLTDPTAVPNVPDECDAYISRTS